MGLLRYARLAHKLTLGLTIGISAIMVGDTYVRVQGEIAFFMEAVGSNKTLAARVLGFDRKTL